MSKAQKDAYKAYLKNLLEQGIEKELAEVMAKTLIEYCVINPVVNY